MNRRLGGVAYWRAAGLKNGVMRAVMSNRSERPEITAEEAKTANTAIPGFNNKLSYVYQVAADSAPKPDPTHETAPFSDTVDWVTDSSACSPPG